MHSGSLPGAVVTNAAVSDPVSGEVAAPSALSFRSAARVGNWKVRRYLSNWRETGGLSDGLEHAGWVIYQEDIDALAVLRRASGIGEFADGEKADEDEGVLEIGRYYGWECPGEGDEFEEQFQVWAEPAIGPVVPDGFYTPMGHSPTSPRGRRLGRYISCGKDQSWYRSM